MKKILLLLITLFCITLVSAQVGVVKSSSVGAIKVMKEKKVKEPKEFFLGVNAGIGTTFGKLYNSFDANVGLDFAVANKKKSFAYGFFASYQTMISGFIGPLFMFGKNISNSAFIFGVGYAFECFANKEIEIDGINVYRRMDNMHGGGFRLGYQFSKSLYATVNIALGKVNIKDDLESYNNYDKSECLLTSLNVSVGYKFNMHKKSKTANE